MGPKYHPTTVSLILILKERTKCIWHAFPHILSCHPREGTSLPWKVVDPSWFPDCIFHLFYDLLHQSCTFLPSAHTRETLTSPCLLEHFPWTICKFKTLLKILFQTSCYPTTQFHVFLPLHNLLRVVYICFLFYLIICSVYILLFCGWVPHHTKKKLIFWISPMIF